MDGPASNQNKSAPFGWGASLVGGLFAVGAGAFFGTVYNMLGMRTLMVLGLSVDQAQAWLVPSYSLYSLSLWVVSGVVPSTIGGYLAAKHGGGRPLVQGLAVGMVELLFIVTMRLAPGFQPGPVWYGAISILMPVAAGVIGGALYGSRKA